jgi:hypothetical protein
LDATNNWITVDLDTFRLGISALSDMKSEDFGELAFNLIALLKSGPEEFFWLKNNQKKAIAIIDALRIQGYHQAAPVLRNLVADNVLESPTKDALFKYIISMHDLDARTVLRKLAETNDLSQQTAVLVAAAALDPGASYLVRFVNGINQNAISVQELGAIAGIAASACSSASEPQAAELAQKILDVLIKLRIKFVKYEHAPSATWVLSGDKFGSMPWEMNSCILKIVANRIETDIKAKNSSDIGALLRMLTVEASFLPPFVRLLGNPRYPVTFVKVQLTSPLTMPNGTKFAGDVYLLESDDSYYISQVDKSKVESTDFRKLINLTELQFSNVRIVARNGRELVFSESSVDAQLGDLSRLGPISIER